MNIRKNAKLTPLGRERMIKMTLNGQTPARVAVLAGVCPGTASKWLARYQAEGLAGLQDRSSRPKQLRQSTHTFAATCRKLGLKDLRTKPYTPRTNGKAKRFIQIALREWAYAGSYQTSRQRVQNLPIWTHRYNWHRPHGGIKDRTPLSRLNLSRDNLLRLRTQPGFLTRKIAPDAGRQDEVVLLYLRVAADAAIAAGRLLRTLPAHSSWAIFSSAGASSS